MQMDKPILGSVSLQYLTREKISRIALNLDIVLARKRPIHQLLIWVGAGPIWENQNTFVPPTNEECTLLVPTCRLFLYNGQREHIVPELLSVRPRRLAPYTVEFLYKMSLLQIIRILSDDPRVNALKRRLAMDIKRLKVIRSNDT